MRKQVSAAFMFDKELFHRKRLRTAQLPQEIAYHQRKARYWGTLAHARIRQITDYICSDDYARDVATGKRA